MSHISIESLYAFVIRNDDGQEGLMGFMSPLGWTPMVGADMERMSSLEHIAQDTANATGRVVQLVHFTKREEIKLIEPNRLKPGKAIDLGGGALGIIDHPS